MGYFGSLPIQSADTLKEMGRGTKIGETPVVRGQPPVQRTLEVLVDEDWRLTEKLEKCVVFQESQISGERISVIFSRSISAEEARAFAALLARAAEVIESVEASSPDP